MRFLVLGLLISSGFRLVQAQIIPTNEWVNFYSATTTLDGAPVPCGTVIDAYDPDGVHCGTFTVITLGQYGFMPVYRDDPTTDIDEGASLGDTISFTINGLPAEVLGPDANIWTTNGDVLEVDLEGFTNFAPHLALPETLSFPEDSLLILELDDFVSDVNDPDSTLTWRWFPGKEEAIVTLSIDTTSHEAVFSAPENWNGIDLIVLTVTDPHEAWDTDTVIVVVSPVNDPPSTPDSLLHPASGEKIPLGLAYFVWTASSDPDTGDVISYTIQFYSTLDTVLVIKGIMDTSLAFLEIPDYQEKFELGNLYYWRVKATDQHGGESTYTSAWSFKFWEGYVTEVGHLNNKISPTKYELKQNRPNPFNSLTTMGYQLPKRSHVSIRVYNILGQELRVLFDGEQRSGYHTIQWDGRDETGRDVPSGIYLCLFRTGDFEEVKKMILIR